MPFYGNLIIVLEFRIKLLSASSTANLVDKRIVLKNIYKIHRNRKLLLYHSVYKNRKN